MRQSKITLKTLKEAAIQLYLLSGLYTLISGGELKQLRSYRRFRVETYAGKEEKLKVDDVVDFLNWCQLQRKLSE